MALEPYITYNGLEHVNESIDALHGGSCLHPRAVVQIPIQDSIQAAKN